MPLLLMHPGLTLTCLLGKGVWFLFFQVITYVLLPSSPEPDFTVFFFPRDSEPEKKNRKPKFSSSPKKGKKRNWFEKKIAIFSSRFFFRLNPEGKKKPLKFVLPSYFFGRPTVLYVITWKKKTIPHYIFQTNRL